MNRLRNSRSTHPSFSLVLLAILVLSCIGVARSAEAAGRLTVMAYNVENLFDTSDDPGKRDGTFLPLTKKQGEAHQQECAAVKVKKWRDQCLQWDWSDAAVKNKVAGLGRAIAQAAGGKGPDVVLLQEVENAAALKLLAAAIPGQKLKTEVLVEGADARGIDVAVLSRFPLAEPAKLHAIPFEGMEEDRKKDTRGILEARFKTDDGLILTAFSVHFPAPFHPRMYREQAMRYLNKLGDAAAKRGDLVVAGGDFNVIAEEDSRVYRRIANRSWFVSHLVGCEDCLGTNYYEPKDSWSFLDAVMVHRQSIPRPTNRGRWDLDRSSVSVLTQAAGQVDAEGRPQGMEWTQATGVTGLSDHLPVALNLVLR